MMFFLRTQCSGGDGGAAGLTDKKEVSLIGFWLVQDTQSLKMRVKVMAAGFPGHVIQDASSRLASGIGRSELVLSWWTSAPPKPEGVSRAEPDVRDEIGWNNAFHPVAFKRRSAYRSRTGRGHLHNLSIMQTALKGSTPVGLRRLHRHCQMSRDRDGWPLMHA